MPWSKAAAIDLAGRDVLDAVAFRRSDLPAMLHQGDRIDVVARATSREFGGFESIQLEVVDVAAEGAQPATAGASPVTSQDPMPAAASRAVASSKRAS